MESEGVEDTILYYTIENNYTTTYLTTSSPGFLILFSFSFLILSSFSNLSFANSSFHGSLAFGGFSSYRFYLHL
jgi:hypothetical protein